MGQGQGPSRVVQVRIDALCPKGQMPLPVSGRSMGNMIGAIHHPVGTTGSRNRSVPDHSHLLVPQPGLLWLSALKF